MRRAVIEDNVMENSWASAQDGTAIVLTPMSEQSGPDTRVEDIVFRSNIIRNAANAIMMTGADYTDANYPNIPVQNSRVRIENNFFNSIQKSFGGDSGGKFLLLASGPGPNDLTFDHNTIENQGTLIYFEGGPVNNLIFTNNIANHNEYGVFGSGNLGSGIGTQALQAFTRRFTFKKNAVAGAESSRYPNDNFYAPSFNVNSLKGRGSDGKDIGADLVYLKEMEKKVIAGTN